MNLLSRTWDWLCSLKLAIVLATAATLLIMGGSLLIPGNPRIFASMDALPLGTWLSQVGSRAPGLSWWVYAAAVLMVLLGINTLCCFIDWLLRLNSRWRKTGEYLIHLGFILVLTAYVWGSAAGFRSEAQRIAVGQTLAIPQMPGHYLRLEAFEPVFGAGGRPLDMVSTLTLLMGETVVASGTVRTNHPLTYGGLAVLAVSLDRSVEGFRFFQPGRGQLTLTSGSTLPLPGGALLEVLGFVPHARRLPDGRVVSLGENLIDPAMEFRLRRPGEPPLHFWHFLKGGSPPQLGTIGVELRPTEPAFGYVSILNIHHDPGTRLALVGAVAMLAGVLLALVSFYRKRSRGDRPEI
ncbi:hypothetical protein DESUT3_28140 [Desulfuromonas versatilis]|uniref:ResB-like domain-containing protein n=1 Tax=Desulfuromonas versatilis TaxID=2802975 RepID=A0ABM8HRS3_9BACT|nr:cytochrome c biogenesis protein ResB [Desulfuromonas versatilis]BCR05745.1 hypothetical protein DESUT3_28140 [Desulfuromonas versatilis]